MTTSSSAPTASASTTQPSPAISTISVEVTESAVTPLWQVEIPTRCPTCDADFTKPRTLAVYSTATVRQLARIRSSGQIDDYTTGDEVESGPTVGINCASCSYDLTS